MVFLGIIGYHVAQENDKEPNFMDHKKFCEKAMKIVRKFSWSIKYLPLMVCHGH